MKYLLTWEAPIKSAAYGDHRSAVEAFCLMKNAGIKVDLWQKVDSSEDPEPCKHCGSQDLT